MIFSTVDSASIAADSAAPATTFIVYFPSLSIAALNAGHIQALVGKRAAMYLLKRTIEMPQRWRVRFSTTR